jgi:hypothetical protein
MDTKFSQNEGGDFLYWVLGLGGQFVVAPMFANAIYHLHVTKRIEKLAADATSGHTLSLHPNVEGDQVVNWACGYAAAGAPVSETARALLACALSLVAFVACAQDKAPTAIVGTWKVVTYEDRTEREPPKYP